MTTRDRSRYAKAPVAWGATDVPTHDCFNPTEGRVLRDAPTFAPSPLLGTEAER